MIDGAPQVNHLAIQLHLHFAGCRHHLPEAAHALHPLPGWTACLAREDEDSPCPKLAASLVYQLPFRGDRIDRRKGTGAVT